MSRDIDEEVNKILRKLKQDTHELWRIEFKELKAKRSDIYRNVSFEEFVIDREKRLLAGEQIHPLSKRQQKVLEGIRDDEELEKKGQMALF